ncbi:TonB-dependent receptor [Phenylobacterium sp.]|uniref:TonB-dependent receptor n=1 Tax=Phenylobacterium sp. TaxID=1871053 RepID=UPI00289963B6|nr:TonB-dependent receptor [Phenylobacterium sp.]
MLKTAHVRRRTLRALLAIGASAIATEQAFAQAATDPLAVEEVIVTAQKREQKLKDVPISIAAFSGANLEQQNLTDFERLSTRTPGFFVQQQTDSSASFVMRGIEAGNAGAVSEPSISFFLNDVDTSRSRGMLKELFDIERVEVAKGPQGTLYGRGSQIGAVAVVTRRPDLSQAGWSLEGQYGSYNLYSITGMANLPIIEDELGLRVAVRRREREGYANNLGGSKKLNDDDLWTARASLRWTPSPDLTFDLILDHQADNDAAAMTKAINIASPGGDTDWFSDAGQTRYQPPQKRRQSGAALLADWDFAEGWNLKSISAWREVDFSESWDVDGTTYDFLIGRNLADDQSILSQEFRLAYDQGGAFRAVGGVSFYKDKTFNQSEFVINEQLLLAGFPRSTTPVALFPVPGTNILLPVTTGNSTLSDTRNDRESWSAYANGSYDITDRLVLDAGVRFTHDKATVRNSSLVSTVDGVQPIALPNGLSNSLGHEFANSADYDMVQPRIALTYRLTDQVNIYAGASRGLKAGYPQTTFGAPVNGQPTPVFGEVKTEEVVNFEIGAKGTLMDRLYFEAAAFTYDYNDFQTRAVDLTVGVVNAGKASAWGVELNGGFKVTPELTLSGAYAYLHTQYDEFREVVGGQLVDRSGNVFRMAPEHTTSLSADYRRPLAGSWDGFVNANYAWRSEYFLNNDNLDTEKQKAFGLVDLRIGAESAEGLLVEAYAENLLDQDWVRDVGNGGKFFGVPTSIRANPRMVGVRVRIVR